MIIYRIAFASLVLMALLWSVLFYQNTSRSLDWQEDYRSGLTADDIQEIDSGNITIPDATSYSQVAEDVQQNFFPPQTEFANQLIRKAIQKQPYKSAHWMDLSYTAIRSGNADEALHFLEQAERLDPGYVDLRIETISLWLLLDQKDKALANFSEVARLNAENLNEAISALALGGVRFEEYSGMINWKDLSTRDYQLILQTFSLDRPSDYNAVLQTLLKESPEALEPSVMISSAVQASSYEACFFLENLNVYQNDISSTVFSNSFKPNELIPNADLAIDPKVSSVTDKFGWLRLSGPLANRFYWLSKYQNKTGVLQIDLPVSDMETNKTYFWDCVIFILPSSEREQEIYLRIQTNHPNPNSLRLGLINSNNEYVGEGSEVVDDEGDWKRYVLKVPPRRRDSRYLVRLSVVHPKQSRMISSSLYIDGVFQVDSEDEKSK